MILYTSGTTGKPKGVASLLALFLDNHDLNLRREAIKSTIRVFRKLNEQGDKIESLKSVFAASPRVLLDRIKTKNYPL